jgi:Ulp1 family protease
MDSIAASIDSFNASVQTRMVEFANTIITHSSNVFKPVYHTSPPQCDGVSCGVFTILNILKVSKAVHDGELESFLADQEWGKKHFSNSKKAEIRSNFVDIIRGTKTVDVLFKFLN